MEIITPDSTAPALPQLTFDDWLGGALRMAKARRFTWLSLHEQHYDAACERAFRRLQDSGQYDLCFRIVPNRIWGDSETARQGILSQVLLGALRLDEARAQIMIWDEQIDELESEFRDHAAYTVLLEELRHADLLY